MKRTAIVLDKKLDRGQCGNVAAILMGQIATCADVYDDEPLHDRDGTRHAAIRYSTVVLKAGRGQLANLARATRSEPSSLVCVVFSETGQSLHNTFPEYRRRVSAGTTDELRPVGVAVTGDDEDVRAATKKFSLM